MTTPDVTVVSSLYRTGQSVAELIQRVSIAMDFADLSWSMVLVDDACPDHSNLSVESHPSVEVLVLEQNVGQHAATSIGIASARGRYIVVIDSDLQDRPEDIPTLIDETQLSGGITAAGRRGQYSSFAQMVTGRAFRWIRWVVSRGSIPSDAGMFLAAPNQILKEIAAFGDQRGHLLSRASALRVPIVTVPVQRELRPKGQSSYTGLQRLQMGLEALTTAAFAGWQGRRPEERNQ